MNDAKTHISPRPKLTKENFDRTNSRFVKLVADYVNWNKENGDLDDDASDYEYFIVKVLTERQDDLDGYALARFLEEECYITPNSELVDILDGCWSVVRQMQEDLTKKWSEENKLIIPPDTVGKKVNAKTGYRTYENHYVTGIDHTKYQVTIDLDVNRKGGYVIDFENVTFVE